MYDPNTYILGTENMHNFRSPHIKNNSKTIYMKNERCKEIERTNKLLYEKMVDLTYKPHFSTVTDHHEHSKTHTKNIKSTRRQKLQDIESQNMQFLKRLENVSSQYSVMKWELDRRKLEDHMDRQYT